MTDKTTPSVGRNLVLILVLAMIGLGLISMVARPGVLGEALSWVHIHLYGEKEIASSQALLIDFVAALSLGILFIVVAHWLRVSAIVVLLIGGIAVGPQGLGLVEPDLLGHGMQTIVSLAVGLILFEGGLTLDPKGYREAAREIRGVLTMGVLVTWLSTTAAIWLIFQIPLAICFLAAGLIIVTGPTVIGPLLKRIRVRKRIHNILHWEGVLIDPVGVFVGLFCYEWIISGGSHAFAGAIGTFLLRMAVGVGIGLVWGLVTAQVVKRGWIGEERLNIAILASAVLNFVIADLIVHESGLLSVTISGMVLGLLDAPEIRRLKVYKAELIELLIGLLFVLLAANLDIRAFAAYGWKLPLIVVVVMLVIRPLNIFLSTWGAGLSLRERLFLGWIAPRGIVAASMASLFALNLAQSDSVYKEYASFLEPFTYSVIAGTVIIQGFSAGMVGKMLGVLEPRPTGWLVVGAHQLGRQVARFIERAGSTVVLIDTNLRSVQLARREGHMALQVNALSIDTDMYPQLYGTGNVLAITENAELNTLVCQLWKTEQPQANLYKWGVASAASEGEAGSDLEVGREVWGVVPYQNLKAINEEGGEGFLYVQTVTPGDIRHGERVLMCLHGETLLPYLPEDVEEPVQVLMYRPFAVRLNLKMRPDWVMVCPSTSMPEAMGYMLDHLGRDMSNLDSSDLHQTLAAQEKEYSSLVGYGVALPHAYSEHLKESVVLVASLKEPVKDLHSGEEIKVIFLVLSPKDDAKNHLNALSEISRFIMDEQNRERLLASGTESELVQLFFPDREVSAEDSTLIAGAVAITEEPSA